MTGLFQKQIIQGEVMFSINFKILCFSFFFIMTLSKSLNAKEANIARVLKYVDELNNLSVSFGDTKGIVSQGKIYVGEKD